MTTPTTSPRVVAHRVRRIAGAVYHQRRDLWEARLHINGVRYGLGYHRTPEEATAARIGALKMLKAQHLRII